MDAYLIVDPDSRNITIPEVESAFGVYGDNNAERKYFKTPRIVGNGIDLTECYLYVNYISASTKIGQILCDVGDSPNGTATEDEIVFSWPITRNVLDKNVSGEIFFAVQAKTKTGDTVFTTRKAKGNCYESIEGTEAVAEEYADIVLQLISRMDNVEANIGEQVAAYFKENPAVTTEYLDQTLQPVKDSVSQIKEDIADLSTREYVNLLSSSDVVSINQVNGFPHSEYEPKQVKTVDMSVVNEKSCEFQIKLNAKANRKYLLSALVKIKSGVGKMGVYFYDTESSNSVYSIYADKVQYNGKNINNSSTDSYNMMIGNVATSSKDGAIICRLRIESNDMTLVAEYSEMCLVDITDIYGNETVVNEYVNMSYSERFDMKPKGISAETKKKLEANLTESKEYTDTKIEAEGHKSNYLYGKKWWAVGDSITYGARSDIDQNGVRKTYATYIADRNGMYLKLDAISGRAMGIKGDRTDSFCMDGYYNNCPFDYPDYITIFLGTNDTEEVGTIDSVDINTFAGAYNKVLDYLTMTYPRAKIGIIPVYNLAEERGKITIALGEKWGVPVFNWDTHSFFYYRYRKNTVMERKQKEFMYFDGTRYEVHPNDTGYQFMSTMIESWMREL